MRAILLTLIMMLCPLTVVNSETMKINLDDWCPYLCVDTENPEAPHTTQPGYELEVVNAIFTQEGYDIRYDFLPWARAIEEVTEGRLDALLSPAKDEAPGLIFPEESIGVLGWCFYTEKESSWNYEGVASLKQVKLGFLHGNDFGGEVQEYIEQNSNSNNMLIQPNFQTNWQETNFKKLAMGRITAILDEPFGLDYFIKKHNLNNQFRKAGCLEGQSMYIAFSPENPMAKKYANMFDHGIRELRKSGELKKILFSYGLSDWK